jgi:hypothetical protein
MVSFTPRQELSISFEICSKVTCFHVCEKLLSIFSNYSIEHSGELMQDLTGQMSGMNTGLRARMGELHWRASGARSLWLWRRKKEN